MDYYAILGVTEQADQVAIRGAFRKMARRYHPDAGNGASAERFREVVEAYETLGNVELRRAYDRARRPTQEPPAWVRPEPVADDYAARRDLFRQFADIERSFAELFRTVEEEELRRRR